MWRALCVVACTLIACSESDAGVCCETVSGVDPSIIPMPGMTPGGDVINDVSRDPAFLCNELTCVSYRGSEAYCTVMCTRNSDCPEGFVCAPVLQSNPGPGSPIQPDDRFCIRPEEQASCDR